jgi:RHS repeat-associated protein
VVANASGSVVQSNHYYPFGATFAESTGTSTNPYKYNGKEMDTKNGLNWLDYGARMMDPVIGRWGVQDPLCETKPWLSPYNYASNNPLNRIDPDGMDDYYYNEAGKQIYMSANKSPDRNYLIKTTQTTNVMYGAADSSQKGKAQPITSEAATTAETEIAAGNLTGDHMQNVVEIQNSDNMKAMLKSIKDDGKGGSSTANNREYSGSFGGADGVRNTAQSNAGLPSKGANLVTKGTNEFHSHPSGTEKVVIDGKNKMASWQQAPSKQDISAAGSKLEYVPAMRKGTIYIYNKTGVVATIPIKTFK